MSICKVAATMLVCVVCYPLIAAAADKPDARGLDERYHRIRKAVEDYMKTRGLDPSASVKRLLVLPFQNASDEKDSDFWGAGFANALSDKLNVEDLVAVGPEVIKKVVDDLALKPEALGMIEVAQMVGHRADVDIVMFGSITVASDNVTLDVKVVDLTEDKMLLSQQYRGSLCDPFKILEGIARDALKATQITLGNAAERRVQDRPTEKRNAFKLLAQAANAYMRGLPDRACRFCDQAVEADPMFAEAYILKAGALLMSGNIKCVESAQQAVKVKPDLYGAHLALALSHAFFTCDMRKALEHARRSVEINPRSVYAHLCLSSILVQGGVNGAMDEIEKCIALDPHSALAHAMRGTMALGLDGDSDSALRVALAEQQVAMEIDPDEDYVLLLGAMIEVRRKEYEKAADLAIRLTLSRERKPQYRNNAFRSNRLTAQVYADFARERLKVGQNDGYELVSKALYYAFMGYAQRLQGLEKGLLLTSVLDFYGQDPSRFLQAVRSVGKEHVEWATESEAYASFAQGFASDVSEVTLKAMERIEAILKDKPDSRITMFLVCTLYGKCRDAGGTNQGLHGRILRVYENLLALEPSNGQILRDYAVELMRAGETAKAKSHLEKCLEVDPDNAAACLALGQVLLKEGKRLDAARLYQRVVELKPRLAVGYLGLALCYLGQGRDDQAESIAKKGLGMIQATERADPDAGMLHFVYGGVCWDRGDRVTAKQHINVAMELAPALRQEERVKQMLKIIE